ncbi:response regulator [Luteipulveratus flavus]|uniref:Response regulator transcription factor n=1 Tax=Luteipulveratus flavus TaxID=3031728 RepID=A0ABT6C9M4_9MICO|nr:response regulator transcription factor [Luteipulveratus sp. YIM 133296]MDF8265608.1 response regulator transcription factor [Luteipulveratus sp. YIM 133296]
MAEAYRVLLVEDHPMISFGLARLLDDEPDLEVVGEARTPDAARRQVRATEPDLIVLPVRLGDRVAGIELCRHLRSTTAARTLVYTAFTDPEDVQAVVLAGADGMVGKSASPADVLAAMRTILRGGRVWQPGPAPARRATERALLAHEQLTGREREVLRLMLDHRTNQQIADALTIEVTTVKTHVRGLLRKLGMGSRRDLFS